MTQLISLSNNSRRSSHVPTTQSSDETFFTTTLVEEETTTATATKNHRGNWLQRIFSNIKLGRKKHDDHSEAGKESTFEEEILAEQYGSQQAKRKSYKNVSSSSLPLNLSSAGSSSPAPQQQDSRFLTVDPVKSKRRHTTQFSLRRKSTTPNKSIPDNAFIPPQGSNQEEDDLMWITMEPTTTQTSFKKKKEIVTEHVETFNLDVCAGDFTFSPQVSSSGVVLAI